MSFFDKIKIFIIGIVSFVFIIPALAVVPAFASGRSSSLTHAPAANTPAGSGASFNWSGYETTAGGFTRPNSAGQNLGWFTGVGATWIIPSVAATSSLTADAVWVGIGGVTAHDLVQVGTQAVTGNGANQVQYQAWFETLPQTTQQIPLTVNAGDSVTGSVTQTSSGEWQVSFRDNTTGGQYATQIAYASSLSSAEWIEEAPSDQDGIMPLDQFGAVSFSSAYAVLNGSQVNILNSGATPLSMANHANQVVAAPSVLNSDGASFTVSRTSAVASVAGIPGNVFVRGRGHRIPVGIQGFVPRSGGDNGSSNGSSSPFSVGSSSGRFENLGRGQFRIQFSFGGLGQQQGKILQFLRQQFMR
jgi:hypothetical protein